mgnify:CR=1 FL=1
MSGFRFRPRARADLREIWTYSADRWGEDQADRYIGELRAAVEAIAERPSRGKSRNELSEGLLSVTVRAHLILYRATENDVIIVRILHQSMDIRAHLRASD